MAITTNLNYDPNKVTQSLGGINYNAAGDIIQPTQPTPVINPTPTATAIPVSTLKTTPTPIVVPPVTPVAPTTYTAPINSVSNDIIQSQANLAKQQQAVDTANTQGSSLSSILSSLESGNVKDVAGTYAQQGVTSAFNQLQDLAVQAQGLQRESQAIPLQIQQGATGRGVTEAGVAPLQTAQIRENALKALSLGQQYAIAEGNYEKAKNYADQLIETKYSADQALINSKITQLNALDKYTLTPAQEKLKEAQKQLLDKQKQQLEAQKETEKVIQDTLSKVGTYRDLKGNPAPQSVIDSIKNSKDPVTATMLSIPYLNDPLERQKKIEDMANARAKATRTSASSSSNLPNHNLINAINNGLIDPNKVNSRTIGIMNTLASAGVDAVASSAGSQTRTAAVKKIGDQIAQTRRIVTVLDKNMPLLYDLADKVNTTNTPGLDKILAGVKTYTGNNPDVIRYVNTIKTIRAEYAQVLARGGEVTEGTRAEAADAIPTGLSGEGYRQLGDQLQKEASNIIDAGNETYNAVLKGNVPTSASGYTLPPTTSHSGSAVYQGYSLPK